jgi:hypothetical protein
VATYAQFEWMPEPGKSNLPPDVTRDALTVAIVGIDGKPRYRADVPWIA